MSPGLFWTWTFLVVGVVLVGDGFINASGRRVVTGLAVFLVAACFGALVA